MRLHTLYYGIASPEKIFQALAPLCGLDNTTLGQISIQENRMSIEVNYFPRTR
ncbi:MAG: hypothetical protein ACLFRE_01300 [Desulfovermiculus sp.]